MVLTAYSALSLVTGLVCHHHRRDAKHHRQLDASVGASGPHDFAVRKVSALVSSATRVHRIPPRVRDDRDTPLVWDETAEDMQVTWGGRESEYFCDGGWTGQITLNWLDKLRPPRIRAHHDQATRRSENLLPSSDVT
jgi:hypothetical protein